jgi:glyoxylase-like metal-dependent hydrolase (beta-lactamase superfamily II)
MLTGDYRIDVLHEGTMNVDGGIAFSGLAKEQWQQFVESDANNKIKLGINQLLVRGKNLNLLVDTGMGNKIRLRKKQLMGINQHDSIEKRLQKYSLSTADITHVVFTHLHYDHAGGTTAIDVDNEVYCLFKNAEFIVQNTEWESACNPDQISRAAYNPMDFLPLCRTNQLRLINSDLELTQGIFLEVTGGHTRGHQMVIINDKNFRIFFPGDICPTPWHLNSSSRESFDLFPTQTLQARDNLKRKVVSDRHSLLVFSHGLEPVFYRLEGNPDSCKAIQFDEN